MRFALTLLAQGNRNTIPINYQYPLSAAIYKILDRADAGYAAFLHDTGYRQAGSLKSFKFFTFSDIRIPFKIQGDRLELLAAEGGLVISFYLPEAAQNFIKGLFVDQQIEIADRKSRTVFDVAQVEALPLPILKPGINKILLEPTSPIVVGRKAENGHYNYRSPMDDDFTECLRYNLLEKYRSAANATDAEIEFLKQIVIINVHLYPKPPQERRPIIREGTPEQTKLRGYTKFGIELIAPKEIVELALDAGLGLYNGVGMGGVRVVDR